jgi:WD40 repeat protein
VLAATGAVFGLAFTPDSKTLVADGIDKRVRTIALGDGAVTELSGGGAVVLAVRVAPDGRSIASLGTDGTIRTWRAGSAAGAPPLRQLTEHGSAVEDADFIEHGRRVVSVGDDGRLLAWSPDGADVAVLFRHAAPLTGVETLARTDHVAIKDGEGAVWDVAPGGAARQVRRPDGTALTVLRASPDGSYLAIGSETGAVTIYETASWSVVKTVKTGGGIRQIAFDPRNRDLLVASESGRAQFGHVEIVGLGAPGGPGGPVEQRSLPWREIAAAVRDVAYAPDGETIGIVCADGGAWLYAVRGDTWVYVRDHDTDTPTGKFSPDGRWFASTDLRGLVVVRDVPLTFAAAVHSPPAGAR